MIRTKKQAFTLIELLVVISIIALLIAILMPALGKARDQAKATKCLANLKGIGVAMMIYAEDNDNYIPRAEITYNTPSGVELRTWQMLFSKYAGGMNAGKMADITEVEIYNCPKYPDKEQTVDYVINAWDFPDPVNQPDGREIKQIGTRLDSMRHKNSTIYMADYEHNPGVNYIKIVRKEDYLPANVATLQEKLRWMDVWSSFHLPKSDNTGRVAYNRHGKDGANNLFFDGHSEWLKSADNGRHMWGGPRAR